jgi:hypothetical protein
MRRPAAALCVNTWPRFASSANTIAFTGCSQRLSLAAPLHSRPGLERHSMLRGFQMNTIGAIDVLH